MKTQKKIILVAVLLMLSSVNYSRISGVDTIRPVQFLSIFVMGLLSGILLKLIIEAYRSR